MDHLRAEDSSKERFVNKKKKKNSNVKEEDIPILEVLRLAFSRQWQRRLDERERANSELSGRV